MPATAPIRVLVVDDSASVRQTLCQILATASDIAVVGTAADPFVAARRIQEEVPDVIILDLEMPRMDGLTFLRKIMAQRPIPVIVCSTLTEAGSRMLFEVLEAGAVDVLPKPRSIRASSWSNPPCGSATPCGPPPARACARGARSAGPSRPSCRRTRSCRRRSRPAG